MTVDQTHGCMEFHVSRAARDHYGFDQAMFSSTGNVIFANFMAARAFAAKMNAKRDLVNFPESAVRPSQLNAMGLIDEMLHVLFDRYRRDHAPNLMRDALTTLGSSVGPEALEKVLLTFATQFPAVRVYRGEAPLSEYLKSSTEGRPNREIVLEEMLMLWLANANPAFNPFLELFDDVALEQDTAYLQVIKVLQGFLEKQPAFKAAGNLSIWKVLRLPAERHPDSLDAQLEFLLNFFGTILEEFRIRGLSSLDVLREEGRYFFRPAGPGVGVGGDVHIQRLDAGMLEFEPENFTADREWMPRLVLIAKNAFVWLDQLSKQYGRAISTLADVPDEELDRLASYGVTGLWLIGLWERSHASKEIKHRMGNPDAVASAYSLYDYAIAHDLGGDGAVDNLRARAWARGVRLASDMVPNHVGIDGKWVIEHPEWFVQLPYPPFPSYSFGSQDLSTDSRVGIHLEDHYYDHSDAAVVFKRVDRWTGSETYIYHGNDGTSLPWNDTAQLNYLNAEAREAVIQTILHVARNFPVIRFDAAMTLAKKHIQRLWFPEPGSGGGIASRAEHGLTKADFDKAIPLEFWREVVDRCAVEAPDTLLLAEAFWMMEGYFVRTLGMHRVYNSAFMNMLRDEKNGEYRAIIKNTLEFEPEILKRYVNFMNNPDERTAVDQFGKGDKYFGVMTLCATLPGLPMIGHGQIEGYTEKYGMEYRRAYYDEQPDHGLIDYHGSQVFPILKKRYLFAETRDFVLFDFANEHGTDEAVYAYSNAHGHERALIVYNNKFDGTRGWVKHGVGGKNRGVGIGEALGLQHDEKRFVIWRENVNGLEFIRPSQEVLEHGLYFDLHGYQRAVMLDWREVYDHDGRYARIHDMLGGRGTHSIEGEARTIQLAPVHDAWRALVGASSLEALHKARKKTATGKLELGLLEDVQERLDAFVRSLETILHRELDGEAYSAQVLSALEQTLELPARCKAINLDERKLEWPTILAWVFAQPLGALEGDMGRSRGFLDEYRLAGVLEDELRHAGVKDAGRATRLIQVFTTHQDLIGVNKPEALGLMQALIADAETRDVLGINRHEGVTYLNQEALEALLALVTPLGLVQSAVTGRRGVVLAGIGRKYMEVTSQLEVGADKAGYNLEKMLEGLQPKSKRTRKPSEAKTVKAKPASARASAAKTVKPKPAAKAASAEAKTVKPKAAKATAAKAMETKASKPKTSTASSGKATKPKAAKATAVKASETKASKPKASKASSAKTVTGKAASPKAAASKTAKPAPATKTTGKTSPAKATATKSTAKKTTAAKTPRKTK